MGEVYLVTDRIHDGAERALKTIRNRFASTTQRDQFLKEFKTLRLLSNPGIVKGFEYGHSEEVGDYFTMEYIPWPTLDTIQDSLTLNQVIHILYDLAAILSAIHCHDIIHSDLKPNNIFINSDGLSAEDTTDPILKIGDFGLARSTIKEELSAIPRGAFLYTAPEILEGKRSEARSDIYSLGMIGFVLLNARIPFTALTTPDLIQEKLTYIPASSDWNETVPKAVRDLITRCLVPDLKFRPRSGMEVAGELARYSKHSLRDHLSFGSTSFVSRSSEMRHLGSLWHNVRAGEQWAYLVTGEEGIGKSRLIDEFALRSNIEGASILRLEGDDISPLLAIAKIDSTGELLSLENSVALSAELTQRSLKAPLMIGWHDFHLAALPVLEWFREYMIQECASPVFWLLEAKIEPQITSMMGFRDRFVRRTLSRLDDDAFIEMLSQLLDSADGYELLARRLIGLVGRKPQTIFKALTDLARHGLLKIEDGHWQIVDPELVNWREGISNGIWKYDRDSLSPQAITLVEWLAVLDQACPISDAIELLSVTPDDWSRLISELARSGIIEVADGVLILALPLIQNSIYQSLPAESCRQNHLWVARWLEERLPQSPSRLSLFTVAKHYHYANAKQDFLRIVRRAIQLDVRNVEDTNELGLLMEALQDAPGEWPMRDVLKGYEDVAFNYLAVNRADEAANVFKHLLTDDSFEGIVDTVRTRLRLGHSLRVSGDYSQALIELEQLKNIIGLTVSDLRADVLANLGLTYFLIGEMKKSLVNVKSFQQLIDKHIKVKLSPKHWYPCSSLLIRHNRFEEGIRCCMVALEDVRIKSNPQMSSKIRQLMALAQIRQGNFQAAIQSLKYFDTIHPDRIPKDVSWRVKYLRANAVLQSGRVREGMELFAQVYPRILSEAHPWDQATTLTDLVRLDFYNGSLKSGMNRIRRILALKNHHQIDVLLPIYYVWATRFYWVEGKSLTKLITKTEEMYFQHSHPTTRTLAGFYLAEHFLLVGKRDLALRYLDELEKWKHQSEVDLPEPLIRLMRILAKQEVVDPTEFDHCDAQVREITDLHFGGMYSFWMMTLAVEMKDWTRMESKFKQTVGQFRKLEANFLLGLTYESYGSALAGLKRHGKSVEFVSQANQIYMGLNMAQHPQAFTTYTSRGTRSVKNLNSNALLPIAELNQIIQMLNTMEDPSKLAPMLLELAMDRIGAQRGLIYLKREKSDELARRASIRIGDAEELTYSRTIAEMVYESKQPFFSDDVSIDELLGTSESIRQGLIRSIACLPLTRRGEVEGILYLGFGKVTRRLGEPEKAHVVLIANLISTVLTQSLLISQLQDSVHVVPSQVVEHGGYKDVIGNSRKMQQVYRSMQLIATRDIPTILLGESGVGKELIARHIHLESNRNRRPMHSLNCAAFPEQLVESLLFGHVRGAFTGATTDQVGFFERANDGTLFLDEIDETSWGTQGKLLRILQEGEYYRVGETKVRKTDVRIIAAAKPTLLGKVEAAAFRPDLYYRLNGFQIELPPLRDRAEDIPLLVDHFLIKYTEQLKKEVKGLTTHSLDMLQRHKWPGNIRELEFAIRKAVLQAPANGWIKPEHLPKEIMAVSVKQSK